MDLEQSHCCRKSISICNCTPSHYNTYTTPSNVNTTRIVSTFSLSLERIFYFISSNSYSHCIRQRALLWNTGSLHKNGLISLVIENFHLSSLSYPKNPNNKEIHARQDGRVIKQPKQNQNSWRLQTYHLNWNVCGRTRPREVTTFD